MASKLSSFEKTLSEYRSYFESSSKGAFTKPSSSSSSGAGSRASSSSSSSYRSGISGSSSSRSTANLPLSTTSSGWSHRSGDRLSSRQRTALYRSGGPQRKASIYDPQIEQAARSNDATRQLGDQVRDNSRFSSDGPDSITNTRRKITEKEYEVPYWWDETRLGTYLPPHQQQHVLREVFKRRRPMQTQAAPTPTQGAIIPRMPSQATRAAGPGTTKQPATFEEGADVLRAYRDTQEAGGASVSAGSPVRSSVYMPIFSNNGTPTSQHDAISARYPEMTPMTQGYEGSKRIATMTQGQPRTPEYPRADWMENNWRIGPLVNATAGNTVPDAVFRNNDAGNVDAGWRPLGLNWPGFGFNWLPGMWAADPTPREPGPFSNEPMSELYPQRWR